MAMAELGKLVTIDYVCDDLNNQQSAGYCFQLTKKNTKPALQQIPQQAWQNIHDGKGRSRSERMKYAWSFVSIFGNILEFMDEQICMF